MSRSGVKLSWLPKVKFCNHLHELLLHLIPKLHIFSIFLEGMIIPNPVNGIKPRISSTAFIAPNATIIGDVIVEAGANIWPNVVLRGDYGKVHVGKNCSVQDNSMLHADTDKHVILEDNVLVGHNVVIHGMSRICEYSMIGIHSTVLDGARLGKGCVLGSGAVTNKQFDPYSLILGLPGKFKRKLEENSIEQTQANLALYVENSKHYVSKGHNHPGLTAFIDETL